MNYIKDKLKVFLEKIRANKRLMYLSLVSVLVLFCLCLNVTYSLFSQSYNNIGTNITINDLEYNLIINDVELSSSVGTKIPTNTIIGDRIILLKAGKTEQFNMVLTSLNKNDTKYEIIYKVCTDVNCTEFIDTPEEIEVAYHIDTPYISGEIKANKNIIVTLVTDNTSEEDYYVQIGLNAGYSHNTLVLTNQITNDFSPASLDGTLSIIGYVNGVEVEEFPTEPNYETGITCLYKDGTLSDARGVFSYSAEKGWEVDVFGLNRSLTTCRVDFTEVLKVTYEVLSTRYDCANLAAGSKPSDPIISYSGNCSVIEDTENDDGTHTWRMKLLTSGELTVDGLIYIDAFLVGGGQSGAGGMDCGYGGGGGNGGQTLTAPNIRLDNKDGSYSIVIGVGGAAWRAAAGPSPALGNTGGATSGFGYSALGGKKGTGSAGGTGCRETKCGGGGSYGNNTASDGAASAGVGQGTTTCEFGEGDLTGCTRGDGYAYAGGGGGGSAGTGGTGGGGKGGSGCGIAGTANTGGGGGGGAGSGQSTCSYSSCGAAGGSGVLVIRDVRS